MDNIPMLVTVFLMASGSKDSPQSVQRGLEAVMDFIAHGPDTEMPIDYDKELEDGYRFKYGEEP